MNQGAAHTPVLPAETIEMLSPAGMRVIVDCTVGLGGHAEALLQAAGPEAILLGIDLDESNLRAARQRLTAFGPRVRLFHVDHGRLDEVINQAGVGPADVIVADLGIASSQLDDPARGMGFACDGPLDMRLDISDTQCRTARDLVNSLGQRELADLIYAYGEERYSRRIARSIVEARRQGPINTTAQLASLVSGAYPAPARRARKGVHPATRTFQALRIAVNDLLGSLERLLAVLPECMAIGGRAAVISFHSLEDRRVKLALADLEAGGCYRRLSRKVVTATQQEVARNPRARSAKLRGIERIA